MKKTLPQYRTGQICLRNINDVDTFTHELGHWLDKSIFGVEDQIRFDKYNKLEGVVVRAQGLKNDIRKNKIMNTLVSKHGQAVIDSILERYELRKELKDVLRTVGYPQISTVEGIAEFIRLYVMQPDIALNTAPKFYTFFERMLTQNESLHQGFMTARRQVKEFGQQDPRQITESTIARGEGADTWLAGVKAVFTNNGVVRILDNIHYNILDASLPFRKLEAELLKKNPNLKGSDNPLLQVLSLIGIDGKATQFLQNKPFRKVGNRIEFIEGVKPLFELIHKPLKDGNLKVYEGYLTALRNLELIKRGLPDAATTTSKVAAETIELYEKDMPELKSFAQDLYKYQDAVLQYYRDAGKISQFQYDTIKELNKYYIPFKRFFSDYESTGSYPNMSKFMKDTSPSPVKSIKGSSREVISPIGSIIKNTYDLLLAADRNTALTSVVRSLQSLDKTLVQEIPRHVVEAVKVFGPEGELETRFTRKVKKPVDAEIITLWVNGDMKFFQIPKQFYDSFFAFNEPLSKAIRYMSLPSRILQAGAVVYDPTFTVRNVPRDQITAGFYTKYGYNPTDFVRGIFEVAGKTETYQRFLASGADQSFLTSMDQIMSERNVMDRVGGKMKSYWERIKSNPLEPLQQLNRASELGTRVGAFRKAFMRSGDVYKAMQEGREISGDYGLKGKSMANVAPLYPFLNARLQHLKKSIQVIKEKPGRVAAKGFLYISAPAILNWVYNNYDEKNRALYKELPTWRKASMFNVKIPGTDSFLPIPKGFWGTLFGTSVESALDWLVVNDPRTVKALMGQLFQEISPINSPVEIIPQYGRGIAEQFANRKGFTNKPIVPQGLEGLPPNEQYTDYTSDVMKKLGKLTGISPLRIEAFITSYTGGMGKNVLNISDEILRLTGIADEGPEDTFTILSKMPITKALFTEVPIGTRGQSVQDFYTKLDELEQMNKQVNDFIKDNKDDKLNDYMRDREYDYGFYLTNAREINKFKQVLRATRDLVGDMKKSDDPGKDEKIYQLQEAITQTAQQFQEAYNKAGSFKLNEALNKVVIDAKIDNTVDNNKMKVFKNKFKTKLRDEKYIPGYEQ